MIVSIFKNMSGLVSWVVAAMISMFIAADQLPAYELENVLVSSYHRGSSWIGGGSGAGKATFKELTVALRKIAVRSEATSRLSDAELQEGLQSLVTHLLVLSQLAGIYAEDIDLAEGDPSALERVRHRYEQTHLSLYLPFDALRAENRLDGWIVMPVEAVEEWVQTMDFSLLETRTDVDFDDDGDLDIFLVNAPGGDNAAACACNNLKQVGIALHHTIDVDADGEPDIGLTGVPSPVLPVLISFLTPAVQKVRDSSAMSYRDNTEDGQ